VDLRPLVLAGHGRDARTTAEMQGLTLPAGVHLLPVFLDSEERLELLENLPTDGGRERVAATAPFGDLAEALGEVDPAVVAENKAQLGALMAKLELAPFQPYLEEQGFTSVKAVHDKLTMDPINHVAGYRGDRDKLSYLLDEAAKATGADTGGTRPEPPESALLNKGYKKLGLYLQGLGGTVFVFLLSPELFTDQEFLTQLSEDVGSALSQLEHSLAQHDGTTSLESQQVVDEYNHLSFDDESFAISGWCNTNRSAPDTRLLPDTDEDRAFVSAVSEMHAHFTSRRPNIADVTEIVLRKNFNTPIYGKYSFGLESYFQLREPLHDPHRARDEARPFDEDLVATPDIAKTRLRSQGISYI